MDDLDYFRFLLALLLVVGLIGLFGFFLRRLGFGGVRAATRPGQRRRLSIQEVASIDARRKLVLVRRDDRDHLILLSSTTDVVIETGIPAPEDTEPEPAGASGESNTSFKRLLGAMRNKSE